MACCNGVGGPPAAHELRHMLQATLGNVQVQKEPDEVGRPKEEGGRLLHCLYLLVVIEGELGNLGGLGPLGLGQRRGSHSLSKRL